MRCILKKARQLLLENFKRKDLFSNNSYCCYTKNEPKMSLEETSRCCIKYAVAYEGLVGKQEFLGRE